MSCNSISREVLIAEIEEALSHADDSVREAWARIRFEPEKWQCSPWGDEGGGFWAVAEIDGQVIWFNDIEDGFNRSPYTRRGVIDHYRCNQDDFTELLWSLPEARAAEEFAAQAPMSRVPPELSGPGRIAARQTTYWRLVASEGVVGAVHFSRVGERHFAGPQYEHCSVLTEHPLLTDYVEDWFELYISGARHRVQDLIQAAAPRVEDASQGWRQLAHYLAHGARTAAVLGEGNGLLLRAPESLANMLAGMVRAHAASATLMRERKARPGYRLLLAGQSYIVAEAFRFAIDAGER